MNKILAMFLIMFSSSAIAEEIKEIPSFYLRPELYTSFVETPAIISNGYVIADNIGTAQQFFDHLPPDVDFDTEKVVVFAWNGSVGDKIEYEKIDGVYNFVFKRGLTNDLQQHLKIVSIPKKYDWLFHRVYE